MNDVFPPFRQVTSRPLIVFMTILFCGVLLYPRQGLPGSGLTQTTNLATWIVVGIWGLWLSTFLFRRLWLKKTTLLLFTGLLLLNLPALWTPGIFLAETFYRLAGTTALAALLWLLLSLPVRGGLRRSLYAVVVMAALIQAFEGAWQVLLPQSAAHGLHYDFLRVGGRATGAFGQANLLGSFLATGVLCALWLMLSGQRRIWRQLAGVAAVPLFMVLMLSESRSAWLGTAAGVAVLLICVATRWQRLQIVGILAAGLLAGASAQSFRPTATVVPAAISPQDASVTHGEKARTTTVSGRLAADREASGRERRALVTGALALIEEHPLSGHGIGSFESVFPAALARSGYQNPFPVTVAHPHNEILYAWSEGGVVALSGLLCWLALWLMPFLAGPKILRRRPVVGARFVVARGALTLPLMTHVMTEFPFYLSAAHGVLMVILLWLALPATARRTAYPRTPPTICLRVVQTLTAICCLAGVTFMVTGLQSSFCIQAAEQSRFMDATPLTKVMNPLAQPERLQFDLAEESLMQFNATHDTRQLDRFQQQAGEWLARYNDAYLIDAMMRISQAQRNRSQAEYWRRRGCLSFHADPRFHCDPINQNGVE